MQKKKAKSKKIRKKENPKNPNEKKIIKKRKREKKFVFSSLGQNMRLLSLPYS